MFGFGLISFLPILIILYLIYFFMEKSTTKERVLILKNLYLYLVSFVTLMMIIVSSYSLINLGLKTWIFTEAGNYNNYNDYNYEKPAIAENGTKAEMTEEQIETKKQEVIKKEEQNKKSQTQRDLAQYISMLIVAIPVFITHWMMIRKKEKQA